MERQTWGLVRGEREKRPRKQLFLDLSQQSVSYYNYLGYLSKQYSTGIATFGMSAAVLKKELDSAREELKALKKENEDLKTENNRLSEKHEDICEQNRELLEENESFTKRMELLQTELSQSQVFSQQEIERLSRQLEMLQKDAELERLHAVNEERRKWETKEDRELRNK